MSAFGSHIENCVVKCISRNTFLESAEELQAHVCVFALISALATSAAYPRLLSAALKGVLCTMQLEVRRPCHCRYSNIDEES